MKTFSKKILTGLALGIGLINPVLGETVIIKDDFNVTTATTGFDPNTGINFGINPPETNRLTGTAVVDGLRYFQTATTRPTTTYSIATNSLMIQANAGIGRFVLSADEATPFDFGPALGVSNATPENPIVYDIRVSMRNNNTTAARFTFGVSTEEGNVDTLDFGLQLYRAASGNTYYTMAKRFDTNSTGQPDFTTSSPKIGTTANNTAGLTFISFLIRVTDAGAESDANYNSRIQVSINNGGGWIYDTQTNTVELPLGFRFDGATRFFVFDQAGSVGDFFYDDFSVTLKDKVRTWTGNGNSNWENANNWAEAAAPATGDALVFNGTTRQTNNNNRGAANLSSVTSITFNNGGFQLQQNPLTISDAITNLAGDNKINLAFTITNNNFNVRTVAGTLTAGNAIDGSGSIQKTGSGKLILGGTNTYVGATTVSEGALFVNGITAQESAISAAPGTTLGGSGTINGPVTVAGTVSPGASSGTLTTGAQTWQTAVTYAWEIDNVAADKIVANTLDIQASTITVAINALEALANWNSATPTNWTLINTIGGIVGFNTNQIVLVDNFSALNPIGSGSFNVTSDGTDLILNFVPGEPGIQILGTRTAGLIQFEGAPNTSYTIEYTDSLITPITWSELITLNSDAEGSVSYQDPADPRPANRFYRVLVP
jgi:autotransporter-associated beta strand protein